MKHFLLTGTRRGPQKHKDFDFLLTHSLATAARAQPASLQHGEGFACPAPSNLSPTAVPDPTTLTAAFGAFGPFQSSAGFTVTDGCSLRSHPAKGVQWILCRGGSHLPSSPPSAGKAKLPSVLTLPPHEEDLSWKAKSCVLLI